MSVPSGLPSMPSLQELGIPESQIRGTGRGAGRGAGRGGTGRGGTGRGGRGGTGRGAPKSEFSLNKVSDGSKRVEYQSPASKNVRPYQTGKRSLARPPLESEEPPQEPKKEFKKEVKKEFKKETKKEHWQKPYPTLKITPYGDDIISYIRMYPILALATPTGSGKTRYVPYRAALEGWKVRVAIPTTVAVRDATRFQKDHSNLAVGFAAGREIRYSPSDSLVYATTGHFNQKILGYIRTLGDPVALELRGQSTLAQKSTQKIREFLGDLDVIDEIHTNSSQITLLVGLLHHLFFRNGNYQGPRLLLSTATFNHGDLIDYFPDFPVFEPPELQATLPVASIFLSSERNLLTDDPNSEILRIVTDELKVWKESGKKFHGIVFRPGIQEVESTIRALEQAFAIDEPINFYPAYGGMIQAELDQIFEPSDRMKVVVGTNIIESSITIDDVAFVIDDMLEKIAETSSTGGQKLSLDAISKASSKQRSGRTGRTIPGRYYPLITQGSFEKLKNFREKEIQRIPIFDIVLQLLDAGLNPRDILKISVSRYDQAQKILQKFGMISPRAEGYEVTEVGRFASSLSLSIQNSYMIYLGFVRYQEAAKSQSGTLEAEKILLRSVIAVACMLEVYGPSFFFIPRKSRNQTNAEYEAVRSAHIEKYHAKFRGATDIHTLVNLFWEMMIEINVVKTYTQSSKAKFTNYVKDWAQNNSMNNKKIQEYMMVMKDVESTVQSLLDGSVDQTTLKKEIPTSGKSSIYSLGKNLPDGGLNDIGSIVATIFSKAYATNRMKKRVNPNGKISYIQPETSVSYKINKNSSFNQLVINDRQGPVEIVAAQTIEVVDKHGKVNLAGIVVSDEYFEIKEFELSSGIANVTILSPEAKSSLMNPQSPEFIPSSLTMPPSLILPSSLTVPSSLTSPVVLPELTSSSQTSLNIPTFPLGGINLSAMPSPISLASLPLSQMSAQLAIPKPIQLPLVQLPKPSQNPTLTIPIVNPSSEVIPTVSTLTPPPTILPPLLSSLPVFPT